MEGKSIFDFDIYISLSSEEKALKLKAKKSWSLSFPQLYYKKPKQKMLEANFETLK